MAFFSFPLRFRHALPGLRMFLLQAFLLCCLAPQGLWAAPHISDFALGMSQEEALLRLVEPCNGALCGKAAFGGAEWDIVLRLEQDKVEAMTLVASPNAAAVEAAFAGITDSPYVLFYCSDGKESFDFIAEGRKEKAYSQIQEEFKAFLETLKSKESSRALYMYTVPDVYNAMRQNPKALASRLPDGSVLTLSLDASSVSILIATIQYMESKTGQPVGSHEQESPPQAEVPAVPVEIKEPVAEKIGQSQNKEQPEPKIDDSKAEGAGSASPEKDSPQNEEKKNPELKKEKK